MDFRLIISKNIATENYSIFEVSIEYEDDFGKSYTENYTYYVPVTKSSGAASIRIEDITLPKGSVAVEKDFIIGFDVANNSSSEVSNGGISLLVAANGISIVINYIATSLASLEDMVKVSIIPLWLAVFGVAFAVFVGVVSEYFLSRRRAMKISSLEAIRTE